jgi:penicillin-binding protein 1A
VSSIYNRATSSRRPGGSAFKLFVYLAALEDGVEPDDVMIDEPVTFGKWSPRNNDRTYRGEMTVRQAFAMSVNTIAVQLAQRVGFDTVADMARRFGITTKIDRQPAMALGTSDVNLLEMTSAYASVARGGVEARPYAITKVTTSRGRTLYTREAEEPRMLVAPWVAAKMTDLLKAVVDSGTGRRAAIGREVAGKTGTTSSNRDGWFLGFTGDIAAGVWMGRDDNKVVSGLAGGRAPTLAWADFMRVATKGMPSQALQTDVMLPEDGFGEPDAEVYGIYPPGMEPPVDENGVPIGDPSVVAEGDPSLGPSQPRPQAPPQQQPRLDGDFLDEILAEPPAKGGGQGSPPSDPM